MGARNLLLPDIGASPDAYCTVSYGGARHVTHAVRRSNSPQWATTAVFALESAASPVLSFAVKARVQPRLAVGFLGVPSGGSAARRSHRPTPLPPKNN